MGKKAKTSPESLLRELVVQDCRALWYFKELRSSCSVHHHCYKRDCCVLCPKDAVSVTYGAVLQSQKLAALSSLTHQFP